MTNDAIYVRALSPMWITHSVTPGAAQQRARNDQLRIWENTSSMRSSVIYGQGCHLWRETNDAICVRAQRHSGAARTGEPRMTSCGFGKMRHLCAAASSMDRAVTYGARSSMTSDAIGCRAPAFGRPQNDGLRIVERASSMRRNVTYAAASPRPRPPWPAPHTAALSLRSSPSGSQRPFRLCRTHCRAPPRRTGSACRWRDRRSRSEPAALR